MDVKKGKKSEDEVTYKQGNRYDEEIDDSEGEVGGIKQSFADNKKIVFVAVGILVVALLCVVIYNAFAKDDKSTASNTAVSDSVKNIVDSDTGTVDTNDDQEQVIIGDDAGISGNSSAKTASSIYTEDEKSKLRAAGYTGDDIEKFSKQAIAAKDAIDKAKAERSKYLQDLYAELMPQSMDGASQEYISLTQNTWLGQKLRPVSKPSNEMFDTKSYKENCRYIKIPPHGGQLFIKLTLKNNDYVFLGMHPDEYDKLDQEGNMVITYDAVSYGKEYYYFNIKEVPIE